MRYIKNGLYYSGNKIVRVRIDVRYYCERYDVDVIDLCEYVVQNKSRVYSIDDVYLNPDNLVVAKVALRIDGLYDFDEVVTDIGVK